MRILCIFFMALVTLQVYSMAPGTHIDSASEAFNVAPVAGLANKTASGIELPSFLPETNIPSLFATKGIPVIISFGANKAPWWALTTGTGYLLISQHNFSLASILPILLNGASYGISTVVMPALNTLFHNPVLQNMSHGAAIAACWGASSLLENGPFSTALYTMAQAMAINKSISWAIKAYEHVQNRYGANSTLSSTACPSESPSENVSDYASRFISYPIFLLAYASSVLKVVDETILLKALLFEQAYRLAQQGCIHAQALFA